MANEIRVIHSGMVGAPTLSGTAGATISVLDAALVNGFGVQTADSLVIAGGVATLTRGAGVPNAEIDVIVEIGGAVVTGGAVNGARRVTNTTSASFTFDATGVPDQAATGTITYKIAPLGWSKPFTGTNLACYKSPNVASTNHYLRVDDTNANVARVVGYEAMTDVNTGTGPFPTAAQLSGGLYWAKSNTADSAARSWTIWGDDRVFYFLTDYYVVGGSRGSCTLHFGDFVPIRTPDPYACAISGGTTNYSNSSSTMTGDVANAFQGDANAVTPSMFTSRGATGVGGSAGAGRTAAPGISASAAYSGSSFSGSLVYPNHGDNGLILSPMYVIQPNSSQLYLRGTMAGIYWCPQNIGISIFANRDKVTGVVGLPGRSVKAMINQSGPMFADITGPWR